MTVTAIAKLEVLFTALACLVPSHAAILPNGSELEVRLLHRVGSGVSHVGDALQAVIIAPVFDHDTILVPSGAIVSGLVEHVDRLGLGLRHTAARLDLRFTQLLLSGATAVPINARLTSVEEARETVTDAGAVIGIHPGASFSTGVSAVFTLLFIGEPELWLPVLAFKFLAARSPDAEITFPAGTEMLLRLTHEAELRSPASYHPVVPLLTASQSAQIHTMLAALSEQQTSSDRNRPSDLINIVLLGSQQAIERAFGAAYWSGSESHGVMALYHMYHGMVQRVGYSTAPMTNLKFNGNLPDESFQKSLNTLSKRHHIRLWRDEQPDVWLGAATEDVRFTVRALRLTHDTDRYIDNERAKVVNDLAFTGCIDRGALVERASLKNLQDGAHSILTDGDVAVLQLNACNNPHLMPSDPQTTRPVRAIRAARAFSKDIARSNPVSVGYAMTKSMFDRSKPPMNARVSGPGTYTRSISISTIGKTTADGVLALR